jgi:hypothetical protein
MIRDEGSSQIKALYFTSTTMESNCKILRRREATYDLYSKKALLAVVQRMVMGVMAKVEIEGWVRSYNHRLGRVDEGRGAFIGNGAK